MHCIAKSAFVSCAIWVFRNTLSRNFSIQPATFIGAAISKGYFTNPLRLAFDKAAFIAGSIREICNTIAPNFAINPVARILIAIRQCVGACSMLQAIAKRALIYAAIIVLFNHNIRSLRRQWCGHQCRRK